jgi:hypothetical protein
MKLRECRATNARRGSVSPPDDDTEIARPNSEMGKLYTVDRLYQQNVSYREREGTAAVLGETGNREGLGFNSLEGDLLGLTNRPLVAVTPEWKRRRLPRSLLKGMK